MSKFILTTKETKAFLIIKVITTEKKFKIFAFFDYLLNIFLQFWVFLIIIRKSKS